MRGNAILYQPTRARRSPSGSTSGSSSRLFSGSDSHSSSRSRFRSFTSSSSPSQSGSSRSHSPLPPEKVLKLLNEVSCFALTPDSQLFTTASEDARFSLCQNPARLRPDPDHGLGAPAPKIRTRPNFQNVVDGEPSLDLAMSLHVLAVIYCSLDWFEKAVSVLDCAILVLEIGKGADHALAAFFGHMQLGDTYSMLGQVDQSIECYKEGLKIQIEVLGDTDPRVGETCS